MPSAASAHTLGPHVVGQRVVVRRLLPGEIGPSGGPAMTDVLGVCTVWDAGVCVVQPERGAPVRIAWSHIVSGKPVPPRPSPRLRVTPDAAQRRAMRLFPDLVTEPLGGWTLRHSPSQHARRANSVLAMAPCGLDAESAYDEVLSWYSRLGQRPIAAVLPDSEQEQVFLGHGWGPESEDGDSVFQLGSVATVARARVGDGPSIQVTGTDTLATATVLDATATGVVALDGDWAGFRGIRVDPTYRRRGLGRAVMLALVDWAAERGATTAYLQVLSDNPPALSLYAGLGFVEHHRYRYLAAPHA